MHANTDVAFGDYIILSSFTPFFKLLSRPASHLGFSPKYYGQKLFEL